MPPAIEPTQAAPTPGQELGTLLTADQLTKLISLISTITDSMHKQISDAFDTCEDSTAATTTTVTATPTTDQPPMRLPMNAQNLNLTTAQSGDEETEAGTRATRTQARRENDLPEGGLPEGQLADLKSDVLEWFQGWRDGIVWMVVDVLKDKGVEAEVAGAKTSATPPPAYEVSDPNPNPKSTTHTTSSSLPVLSSPPTQVLLSTLPRSTRLAILSSMLLLILSKGHYGAPSRILLQHMTTSLLLAPSVLQDNELRLAQGLLEAAKRMSADEETKKRSQENANSRRWKVGLAGVAGAALIGVTGGLAAPLVAGAIGSVMGGLGLGATAAAGMLGTLGSSGVIVGSLFGAYGYGMTSKMMDQYAKEVEDFAFLPMRQSKMRGQIGTEARDVPAEERKLRVTIGVSGWLSEKRDIITPWRVLGNQSEVLALRWELDALLDMGKSLESMVSSAVWTVVSREVVARTVFASLMFAMWPIALLKLSKVVDNPFNVAKNRADKAGLVLADAIINKAQGERPVTLIGYSMGARLIYSCLSSLAERRAFGLVESVVLIGAPTPSDAGAWRAIRSVVSGRLVNAYSEKDFVLAFLYRTSSIQFGIAGLQAVTGVKGVENVDVSATVSGHLRYPHLVGTILEKIGWEDVDTQEVEREQHIVELLDKEDEERKVDSEEEASVKSGEFMSLASIQKMLSNKTDDEPGTGRDPLLLWAAADDITTPKEVHIKEDLAATLAIYVKRETAQRFRCRVPECQKLFKSEHFWMKHVELRHVEWLEGIKQELNLTASKSHVPKKEYANSTLQAQPTPKLEEEEDLMSFDEGSREEPKVSGQSTIIQERQSHGQREQQSLMDMPEEQPLGDEIESRTVSRPRQEIEMSDDEESHGITMVDNEEKEITMLEPIPMD